MLRTPQEAQGGSVCPAAPGGLGSLQPGTCLFPPCSQGPAEQKGREEARSRMERVQTDMREHPHGLSGSATFRQFTCLCN